VQRADEELAEADDAPGNAAQMVVNVAEVRVERGRDDLEVAASELIDRSRQRHHGSVEVERLALEPVDTLGGVKAVGREDLLLDLLDVAVDAIGSLLVVVDDVVEDDVEHRGRAMREEVRTVFDRARTSASGEGPWRTVMTNVGWTNKSSSPTSMTSSESM